jgi:hypothetical protein
LFDRGCAHSTPPQNHAGLRREEESADHLPTIGRGFGFAVLGCFGDHAVKHGDCLADLAGEEVAESVCDATVLDAHAKQQRREAP